MREIIHYFMVYAEPIFFKLLYMSIKTSILGLAILAVKKIFKNKISSKWIYIIWLLFTFSLIVPINLRTPFSIYNIIPIYFENIETARPGYENWYTVENEINNNRANPNFEPHYSYHFLISIIWVVAMLIYAINFICSDISILIESAKKKTINDRLKNILNDCKKELNIRRHITLVNQNLVKIPSIHGIINIKILLNENILELSDEEIRSILIHELSHYERKDNLLNLLIIFIRGIYIFNPIIFWLFGKMRDDIELATDEYALTYADENRKQEYSETFTKLADLKNNDSFMQIMPLLNKKKAVEERKENIKNIESYVSKKKKIKKTSILILCVLFLVFITKGNNYKSLEEMIEFNSWVSKTNNVCIHKTSKWDNGREVENYETDYFWKENVYIEKTKGYYNYYNYTTHDDITICEYYQESDFVKEIHIRKSNRYETEKEWISSIPNFDSTGERYQYLGVEKLNGRKAYKIMFTARLDAQNEVTYWIDKESGLILQREMSNPKQNETTTERFLYKFDTLTDEDIKKPNINDYKDYEIIYDEK